MSANHKRKKITVSRKISQMPSVCRKRYYPIETLILLMQRHKVKEWSSGQQGKGVRFQPLCVIYTFFGRLTSLTHNLLRVH